MFGANVDKLEVQVSKNSDSERQVWMGGYETVWSMQGDHNDTWLHGTVKLGRSLFRNVWLKRRKKRRKKSLLVFYVVRYVQVAHWR